MLTYADVQKLNPALAPAASGLNLDQAVTDIASLRTIAFCRFLQATAHRAPSVLLSVLGERHTYVYVRIRQHTYTSAFCKQLRIARRPYSSQCSVSMRSYAYVSIRNRIRQHTQLRIARLPYSSQCSVSMRIRMLTYADVYVFVRMLLSGEEQGRGLIRPCADVC
jgi:hypothetical protein